MKYRILGKTGLKVSEVGFGCWAIGGPAMAGDIPIGWGDVKDEESIDALNAAYEQGINFYDTADFYGLGHSEELLGKVFKDRWKDIILATKVGHQLMEDGKIDLNYSYKHIINACEQSLKRLNKEVIDVYQLHSAKLEHLQNGGCIEAMQRLTEQGKIRYWGISLNTFNPEPEAEFFIENSIGHTFQLVLNIINQRAVNKVVPLAKSHNYGVIARMPLQFGLLTGKFNKETTFNSNDHRHFRLTPEVLENTLTVLEDLWKLPGNYNTDKSNFSLSYPLNIDGVSSIIPGIRTRKQVMDNTRDKIIINEEDLSYIEKIYKMKFNKMINTFS